MVVVARALLDRYGRLTMIMGGALDVRILEGMIDAHNFGKGSQVAILQADGTPLGCDNIPGCDTYIETDPQTASAHRALRYPMAQYQGDTGGGRDLSYLGGVTGPAAYRHTPRFGLTVVAVTDRNEVLRPWRESLPFTIGLGVMGSGFIWLSVTTLLRQFRLRAQAMRDLADANTSLEAKVAERTRDLQESELRLRGFIQAARDAVVIIDDTGIIEEFNPSAGLMFGYTSEEMLGKNVTMLMPPADAAKHDQYLHAARFVGMHAIGQSRILQGKRADGGVFPLELTVGTHQIAGRRIHVGLMRDITERKAAEDNLRKMANFDALTGVFNRRHFIEEGERLVAQSRQSGRPIAVLMADADHFKSVNDTHGHDVGDRVLKALATTLLENLRDTDILGRLGGEEFAMVLPDTDTQGAVEMATHLLDAVRALRVETASGQISFTVSAGIGSHGDVLGVLLKQADLALYQAKAQGRDRVVIGDAALGAEDHPVSEKHG